MDDVSRLTQLFRYDAWANRKVANALGGHPDDELQATIRLFAHIRAAQQMWYARIIGSETAGIALWPERSTLSSDAEILQKMHEDWIELIERNKGDLDRFFAYQNSSGKSFDMALGGILHHIIIHGQHHRAQIAAQLNNAGITPPGTDFLFYLRETNNNNV